MLMDDEAIIESLALQQAFGLKNKAEMFDLAKRVLQWCRDQQEAGYEVGRWKDGVFQPLTIPGAKR